MAELPTGTVTFLFTDIEGSTRLERELRERYGEVLAQHQRLLRAAFAAHGGQELDTQGDSFFYVFPRARAAVEAAVEAQRALAAHSWPEEGRVRVRIGINTGEASLEDGRYVGLAVHRAARISAAGHGGQILLSRPTRDLVEDDLPSGQHVRDLGEARLKDLPRPEHIFQLDVEGLPSEFPPLRTLDEQELAEAAQAALARRRYRRRTALLIPTALLVGAATLALVVALTRDSTAASVDPNSAVIIDPGSNQIIDGIPLGAEPVAIAASNDTVWVATADRNVRMIAARKGALGRTFGLDATPTGLAVGAGAVWVAHGKLGMLTRIDLRYQIVGKPLEVASTTYLAGQTGAVAVGADGIWAAFGDGSVARIDPAGTRVLRRGYSAAPARAIAVTGEGIFVANQDATLTRINPQTATPIGREVSIGREPTAIASDGNGFWVTAFEDDVVSRVNEFASTTVPTGDGPVAVAVGAGAVWVANANDKTVSKINPTGDRPEVVDQIEIGERPTGVAVAGGRVWVTVATESRSK
jgi:class 3 adenylate cyclase/DNA-binding beta-propeller fold protein YncE